MMMLLMARRNFRSWSSAVVYRSLSSFRSERTEEVKFPRGEIETVVAELLDSSPVPPISRFNEFLNVEVNRGLYSPVLRAIDKIRKAGVSFDDDTFHIGKSLQRLMLRQKRMPKIVPFTQLLSLYVDLGQYEAALDLFFQMRELRVEPTLVTLNVVINAACLSHRVDLGLSLFGMLSKYGFKADDQTYNPLLRGFFLVNKVREAELMFKRLVVKKVCLVDEYMFGTVIDGLCKSGDTKNAISILNEFTTNRIDGGFKPGIQSFNSVMNSLIATGSLDEALLLFSELSAGKYGVRIRPDRVTCTLVMKAFCDSGRISEAMDLENQFVSRGMHLDTVTYLILVKAYCRVGKAVEGEKVLELMKKRNLNPKIAVYNALIEGFSDDMKKCKQIFDLAVASGIYPNIVTFNILMAGYCKVGDLVKARELFLMVPDVGLEHTSTSYNILIHAFFSLGLCAEGLEWFEQMQVKGLIPDAVTYTTLLSGLADNDQLSGAISILRKMKCMGIDPSLSCYNSIINALCRSDQLHEAVLLLDEVRSQGLSPNVKTLTPLIVSYCEIGYLKAAADLVDCLEYVDDVAYNIIVKAYLKVGGWLQAKRYLQAMINEGLVANSANSSMLRAIYKKHGEDAIPLSMIEKVTQT